MSYIGTEPAAAYTTTTKQTITGTGVATYTLDYDVASEHDIQVFLNNVRQEGGSGKAYTVSDNQITFASNIASTDDLYVLFTGKAIQTIVPPDGSVTAAKVDSTLHLSTIKDSTGTNNALTIDSTGRVLTPARPAFSVYLGTTTSGIDATAVETDVPFDTIDFNIGSCVAISSDVATFTAPIDGIYHFNSMVQIQGAESAGWVDSQWHIDGAKIGSQSDLSYRVLNEPDAAMSYTPLMQSQAVQLNANQTLKVMFRISADTSVVIRRGTRFSGFLVG